MHPGTGERGPLRLGELIEGGDVEALCEQVDSLVLDGRWDSVLDLRDRCRAAIERGRQLWPVAAWAEYRLCLDAPAPVAAGLVDSPAARFTLGPFAEVLASTHTWTELSPWLPATPGAEAVAFERVVRGEHLAGDPRVEAMARSSGIPACLQPWEPVYPVATYHLDRVEWALPVELATAAARGEVVSTEGVPGLADPSTVTALVDCVRPWTVESNGVARAVAVEGSGAEAVAALGAGKVRLAEVSAADALLLIAWASGGGGAHGRRRGAAAGRFEAWWVGAHLAGLAEDWPVEPDELGDALAELRWWVWAPVGTAVEPEGWVLRIAAASPTERLAWALDAHDHR